MLWDTDWSTVSLNSSDAARTRRVLDAWDGHLAHPALPRTLAATLRSTGFEDVGVEGHAFASTMFDPGTFLGGAIGLIEQYVSDRGDFADDELQAWSADLRELDGRGAFFLALVQFCFTARRAT